MSLTVHTSPAGTKDECCLNNCSAIRWDSVSGVCCISQVGDSKVHVLARETLCAPSSSENLVILHFSRSKQACVCSQQLYYSSQGSFILAHNSLLVCQLYCSVTCAKLLCLAYAQFPFCKIRMIIKTSAS